MKLSESAQKRILQAADFFYKIRPQSFPGKERLRKCKIVSHRGEHDNITVYENTVRAFDLALERGIWGIEFDFRWTKDLHPVVIHDTNLERVFDLDLDIGEVNLEELKSRCPAVPSLSEVIQKYGKKLHLMAEIKAEIYPDPQRQNNILKDCFSGLEPQTDFHLISLTPEMFDLITFIPTSTFIPIATLNLPQISELALTKGYHGVAGHYSLLNNSMLAKHHKQGQKVGSGYPASKYCLFREINRNIEWIFSNNAGELQAVINKLTDKCIS